jgi:transposase
MSAAYTKGVSDNLGNARVVYDKFHVIQKVVEACDQVRKAESRSDAGERELLERTRWMRLKNRANWTEKETHRWESMSLERCVTGMAYEMRLVFQGIYQWKDVEVAKKPLGNWCLLVLVIRELTEE